MPNEIAVLAKTNKFDVSENKKVFKTIKITFSEKQNSISSRRKNFSVLIS